MPAKRRDTTSASPSIDTGTPAAPSEEQTLTIRLPFLTVSVARPAGHPATTPSQGAPRSTPTIELPVPGAGSAPRLLYYAGVAALGVAGVVEWPVAAAIAAGTYIASRSRSAPAQPPPPGPEVVTVSV